MATRLQWHPQLHRDWGKERLCFWRLGFHPTYDRDIVKAQLESLFRDSNIHSYALYELIGLHDLMLRIWLPTSLLQGEFKNMLSKTFGAELVISEPFTVDEMISHWVWSKVPGEIRPVASTVLENELDASVIDTLNGGHLPKVEREEWEEANVIAPSGHGPGIKFFVIVTSTGYPLEYVEPGQTLRDKVISHLKGATTVKEKSLYEGSGFGHFVIMGKVPFGKFRAIFEELIDPINEAGLKHHYHARTYTHICTTGLVDFQDRMPSPDVIADESDTRSVEEYLGAPESQTLEVKSSALVDLSVWLHTKKTTESEKILIEGVLRATVGMLNADGGTIIVGAGELKKWPFSDVSAREKVASFPKLNDAYVILGLDEFDFRVSGQDKDWDAFSLRLARRMRELVEPSPVAWVTFEPGTLSGRTLAIIHVRPPDSGWFYLKPKKGAKEGDFLVRHGNATEVMTGYTADVYKRAKDRL